MKTSNGVSLLVLACAFASATPASAQSLRCRNDLANVGDDREAVRRKCGEPAAKERVCERSPPDRHGRIAPCLDVENWTYRPGYGQYVTTLRFEDGTLVRISYGDRM